MDICTEICTEICTFGEHLTLDRVRPVPGELPRLVVTQEAV